MIAITGPYRATEEGRCQACTTHYGAAGTKPEAQVYVVDISKSIGRDTHGASFRLCERCLLDLWKALGNKVVDALFIAQVAAIQAAVAEDEAIAKAVLDDA